MTDWMKRITIDPDHCGVRPCVRGMRIGVTDILDLLANGLSREAMLEEFPDLEAADIGACLRHASQKINHPGVAGSRHEAAMS